MELPHHCMMQWTYKNKEIPARKIKNTVMGIQGCMHGYKESQCHLCQDPIWFLTCSYIQIDYNINTNNLIKYTSNKFKYTCLVFSFSALYFPRDISSSHKIKLWNVPIYWVPYKNLVM